MGEIRRRMTRRDGAFWSPLSYNNSGLVLSRLGMDLI